MGNAILYVDDQPSHRALFKKAFGAAYQVLTASSGEEGLEIVKGHEVFLMIADHNMPGMTGIDFLEKAEKLSPKAERAILSAYLNDEIIREANRRVRVTEHLKKPWKLDRMRGFIEDAFERYAIQRVAAESQIREPEGIGAPYQPPVTSTELAQFVDQMKVSVNQQGARRIFLNFVEPRLKENVPLIRRPYPSLLSKAQQEALRGDFEALQKSLAEYLKEEGLGAILRCITDELQKTIH